MNLLIILIVTFVMEKTYGDLGFYVGLCLCLIIGQLMESKNGNLENK